MKPIEWLILFVVVTVGVTLGNLVALKVAADQVSGSLGTSPLASVLAAFSKK